MSDAVAVALIAAIPATAAAILGGINMAHGIRNGKQISDLTVRVDGRLDELLASAGNAGRLAEQSDQRDRDAAKQSGE
jgi:hypothetical protein